MSGFADRVAASGYVDFVRIDKNKTRILKLRRTMWVLQQLTVLPPTK
jgi:hypothetical protein